MMMRCGPFFCHGRTHTSHTSETHPENSWTGCRQTPIACGSWPLLPWLFSSRQMNKLNQPLGGSMIMSWILEICMSRPYRIRFSFQSTKTNPGSWSIRSANNKNKKRNKAWLMIEPRSISVLFFFPSFFFFPATFFFLTFAIFWHILCWSFCSIRFLFCSVQFYTPEVHGLNFISS